ncbi:MAG: type II secretion system F family protein [Cryobacterium sp.]|nr:type II secretion system F family protein [Oligoflexia bacterium]
MPEYKYEGVDKQGKRVKGQLNAASEGDLRVLLRGQGVRPIRIAGVSLVQRDLGSIFGGSKNITKEEVLHFTRQLQVLLGSGVPLVQSLDILADQASSASLRSLCQGVKNRVSEGAFLWESLSAYEKSFPRLYLALVRAGESSGSLDQMLKRLSAYLEDADRLRKMLKAAMMYPAIVISIGIAVISAMLIFVIPKFEELIKGSGGTLPGPTQFVIDMSHFLGSYGIYLAVFLGVGGFILMKFFESPEGRIFRDRALFKAPLFGPLMLKGGTARFTRTLGTLLASGVSLLDAIDICRQTIDNAVLEEAVGKVRTEIEQGKSLSVVFMKLDIFPKMAIQMMAVGENTGQLDKMLEKVADFYEAEVEALVGGLTKLIEPFILVFLGGTVGGMMIAMYLPIFKMGDSIK